MVRGPVEELVDFRRNPTESGLLATVAAMQKAEIGRYTAMRMITRKTDLDARMLWEAKGFTSFLQLWNYVKKKKGSND